MVIDIGEFYQLNDAKPKKLSLAELAELAEQEQARIKLENELQSMSMDDSTLVN